MDTQATFNFRDQGWQEIKSAEELLEHYPKHVYGTYRPQPWSEPEQYPCLFKEMAVINNDNGPDWAVLAYVYEYETR